MDQKKLHLIYTRTENAVDQSVMPTLVSNINLAFK